jgi:arginyl-tRNA synthetase
MDIKEKIKQIIAKALDSNGINFSAEDIVVEIPNEITHGDYSSNIAMRLASQLKKNPLDIAKMLVSEIEEISDISEIKVIEPGFVNFFVSKKYLLSEVSKIANRKEQYFNLEQKESKKIIIEYTDANPFKEFHIGHLYTNSVGECFARLQEALGAEVKRANYQGDIGLHVAKTLWGLEKKMQGESVLFQEVESLTLVERVKYLAEAYVLGVDYYDDLKDQKVQEEIDRINHYLFTEVSFLPVDDEIAKYEEEYRGINLLEKYKKGRQWCLEYFETIYERLGTSFDYYFFESEVGRVGLELVMKNIGEIFEEDDGSIIYRGDEEKNLHTRVFVNKYGVPTYEAKELGLALKKGELVDYDESIVITGNEQSGYFKVVLDALSKIDKDLSEKTTHVPHGMIRLPNLGKMSSRKGEILSGETLLELVKQRVIVIMKDSDQMEEEEIDTISEKIAVGAIKYAFLKITVGRDIVFDIEKSISFDGDTGPYLMYVYSRCNSILKEANFEATSTVCISTCTENPVTRSLFSWVSRYKGVLLDSAVDYSPSTLTQYLFNLGQSFNSFYQNVRVIDASDEERDTLLVLVKATMIVMKDGLSKLGIRVVERM